MRLASKPLYSTLSVVRLDKTDWRVSDAVQPDLILGFIERQRASRFEITWMSDPIRWGYATSFDAALGAFADSAHFTGEILSERDESFSAPGLFAGRQGHRSTWLKPGKTPTAV